MLRKIYGKNIGTKNAKNKEKKLAVEYFAISIDYDNLGGYTKTVATWARIQCGHLHPHFHWLSGFTGNIAKLIGIRYAMIFYTTRSAHTLGATHGGAPAPPHIFGEIGEGGLPPSTVRGGGKRHNLAIILVFISVRPLLSPT